MTKPPHCAYHIVVFDSFDTCLSLEIHRGDVVRSLHMPVNATDGPEASTVELLQLGHELTSHAPGFTAIQ